MLYSGVETLIGVKIIVVRTDGVVVTRDSVATDNQNSNLSAFLISTNDIYRWCYIASASNEFSGATVYYTCKYTKV